MPNNYTAEQVNDLFIDYNIEHHIDSGGFKDVFKADLDGETVVVKIFPVESREMRRRARREARAMEEVDSPILVDLIEHFVEEIDDRTSYVIVEEYIPGDTLSHTISVDDTSTDLGINVVKSLLLAFKEFDKNDLVHRDIKPSNIIISPGEEVNLLDVGIVRFQEEESLTPDHRQRGPSTPPYAAPEVLRNDKAAQDVRTDMFSAGIVLYESVTGNHPFGVVGMSRPEAIQEGARKEDLDAAIDNTELGEQLNEFYLRLTEHQQHDRFRKPEHALEELEYILEVTK